MFGASLSAPSSRKPKQFAPYVPATFLARPKMGALKNLYVSNKFPKLLYGSSGYEKKKKAKKSSPPKMEYIRRKPDYADNAYREAVGRLRILLAESYTPLCKRSIRELDSGGEETDNQSVVSVYSRSSRYPYHHHTCYARRNYYPTRIPSKDDNKISKFESSPELSSFIERQEDYIEQLERESKFCREELANLLSKVKEVISENENLHERQKSNLMKSVFEQFETTETETDNELVKTKVRTVANVEAPSIVYQSRISELEAQLTQAKFDLKKAQENNAESDAKKHNFCEEFDHKHKIEVLQKQNATLEDTVSKLQSALNMLKDKEHNSSDQVKRSLDVAEQAQYEKSAADHEIRRLKDELERQHGKVREAVNEQNRRVAEERSAVERRYTQQIEQLTSELGVQWEQSSKLQLELDKQRRENSDSRRELAQKQALIDELKKEMQNKIITLQSDIGVSGAEKSALEQQIAMIQMTNERYERQNKQEAARVQVEMQSLRQRLDRADADLIHSKRENVRLTEQIAALEKEINLNAALADEKKRSETITLPPPPESDVNNRMQEMESKHAATVAEMEEQIKSQNQLMDKLSAECHALTQKLDESSMQHKEEIRELQANLGQLSNQFSQSQLKSHNNPEEHVEQTAPELSRTGSISSPQQDASQSYYNTDQYNNAQESNNQQYDPNYQPTEGYDYSEGQYADQQYDPNQQYLTQEQYDEQQQQGYDQQYDPSKEKEEEYSEHKQNVEDTEKEPKYQPEEEPSDQKG